MRCTFIPPYLFEQLDPDDRHRRHVLELDEQLRQRRARPPRTLRAPRNVTGETRIVHDARNTEELPGQVRRRDGDPPTGDLAVDEAFDYSGLVWDLFAEEFRRRSVDGNGTPLSVTVHYGTDYDNAFWDGEQLVFGDGDGQIFERFTKPMDVLAHEFTHGVTQFTAGLVYQGQSGALNESVSDVFASMAKQRHLDQTSDQADWLIGEGIFRPGVQAKALRSMTEPGTAYDDPRIGKDPQVGSMRDYIETEEDNGGVHLNSGIPNRAFALAALKLGGHSWQQAGQIWYDAITSGEVSATTDFEGFASATVSSASRLFTDPEVAEHVRTAWTTVGLLNSVERRPAPAEQSPPLAERVAVRRTGGFAGIPRAGVLKLDTEPAGPEVRELLLAVDFHAWTNSTAAPDRFVYTLEYGPHRLTVQEPDLTPELHRVVQLVLGQHPEDSDFL
ncbi:MAG TPA: protealysin inhibitor emfourin [Propionibacteriaceae bacterium]